MSRLPRIRVEGAIYYVIARGSQDGPIFKDKDDYKMYLELVSKYKTQHKFKLFSYNLLADRIELLIETGDDASISEVMHDLSSLYTKYFNSRHQKRGHLFESRFRSVLVEKVNYLLAMTRHIHLRDVQNPYSSFRVYVASSAQSVIASAAKQSMSNAEIASSPAAPRNDNSLDISEEIKEVFSFLKNKDNPQAYEQYVLQADPKETRALEKSLRRGGVLGSDAFQEEVKRKVAEHAEFLKEESKPKKISPVYLFLIGGLVVLATASSVSLYVRHSALAGKYEDLLKQKEVEFSEKTKFENQSPLSLTELDGTVWQIDSVPLPRGGVIRKDRIRFKDGRFESEFLAAKGFRSSNYFLVPQGGRVVQWQAAQSNPSGDTVTWRGTWQGDAMKGVMSVKLAQPATKTSAGSSGLTSGEAFSFFSTGWTYLGAAQ